MAQSLEAGRLAWVCYSHMLGSWITSKYSPAPGARLHVYASIDWRSVAAAPTRLENGLDAWFQVMARREFR